VEESTTTQRLLFQKVQKAFDNKDSQLASSLQRIKVLEAQVAKMTGGKRKKVKLSPNSKFVDIESIRKAQIEARHIQPDMDESSKSELSSDLGSCIVVDLRGEESQDE
jgi:hypothetical protein